MKKKETIFPLFKTRELDLATFLIYRGHKPQGDPIEDAKGVRWIAFEETAEIRKDVYAFILGNKESQLLHEFRRTRSFLLDSQAIKETREE